MIELWHGEFVFEITFSKYCSFDSHGDVINQKWCQKRSKLIFHVTMVIERWKSIVKGYSRWSISFWNHYLKILKFWLNMVMSSTQNWFGKGPKLVSLVLMVVERWGTLRWRILLWNIFSKSWNSSSMLWRHDLKIISKRLRSVNHVQLVVRLKSGTRITLVQKIFFSPSRISDTPRAGFEPAQNLSSGLVESSSAVVINTTPRRHNLHDQDRTYIWDAFFNFLKLKKILITASAGYLTEDLLSRIPVFTEHH